MVLFIEAHAISIDKDILPSDKVEWGENSRGVSSCPPIGNNFFAFFSC